MDALFIIQDKLRGAKKKIDANILRSYGENCSGRSKAKFSRKLKRIFIQIGAFLSRYILFRHVPTLQIELSRNKTEKSKLTRSALQISGESNNSCVIGTFLTRLKTKLFVYRTGILIWDHQSTRREGCGDCSATQLLHENHFKNVVFVLHVEELHAISQRLLYWCVHSICSLRIIYHFCHIFRILCCK